MSVWLTEEVIRWGLRLCSRRSQWHQRRVLVASVKDPCFPNQQLRLSPGTRQHLTSPLVSSVRFYSQGWTQNEDTEETEHVSSSPPALGHPEESISKKRRSHFMVLLERCRSPSDVLDLTTRYAATPRQVSNSLTHMWTCTKKMTEEQQRYELQLMFDHPALEKFLQNAMNNVDNMRDRDIAYALIAMVGLRVPQRSRVVQTFLRACQENLNDFDEKCLSILSSSLDQMESSPNVSALKDGMRLVVEVRLPQIQSVMALQTMTRLVGKDAPLDLKLKLEAKALSMKEQFTLPNSLHMVSIMASMDFYSKPLLNFCSQRIRGELEGIPFSRFHKLLYSCHQLGYRDVDLLNSVSDYVASVISLWTQKQVILFLVLFESLNFCPESFMEACAEKFLADPDALTLKDLLCVLRVFSSLNYDLKDQREQFLDGLSRVLDSYLPKISRFDLLRTVYNLCLLGHFPSAPLEQLLQSDTLELLKTSAPMFHPKQEKMFQMVDLCLRLEFPPLPRPLSVPSFVLGDPSSDHPPSANPLLLKDLRNVVGEQEDTKLEEEVVVENFYFIDALITKPEPNQTPATEETEETSGSGAAASPAESSHRVAVICPPLSGFCFASSRPLGPLAAKIRHLRILGYNPVLVTEKELSSRSQEERTELLRRRIFPEHHKSDA